MPENDKQGVRSGHEGHRKRLRQRARAAQLEGFQPHEVLELLLTSTPFPGRTSIPWRTR